MMPKLAKPPSNGAVKMCHVLIPQKHGSRMNEGDEYAKIGAEITWNLDIRHGPLARSTH